jgi:hypothetical protein
LLSLESMRLHVAKVRKMMSLSRSICRVLQCPTQSWIDVSLCCWLPATFSYIPTRRRGHQTMSRSRLRARAQGLSRLQRVIANCPPHLVLKIRAGGSLQRPFYSGIFRASVWRSRLALTVFSEYDLFCGTV